MCAIFHTCLFIRFCVCFSTKPKFAKPANQTYKKLNTHTPRSTHMSSSQMSSIISKFFKSRNANLYLLHSMQYMSKLGGASGGAAGGYYFFSEKRSLIDAFFGLWTGVFCGAMAGFFYPFTVPFMMCVVADEHGPFRGGGCRSS